MRLTAHSHTNVLAAAYSKRQPERTRKGKHVSVPMHSNNFIHWQARPFACLLAVAAADAATYSHLQLSGCCSRHVVHMRHADRPTVKSTAQHCPALQPCILQAPNLRHAQWPAITLHGASYLRANGALFQAMRRLLRCCGTAVPAAATCDSTVKCGPAWCPRPQRNSLSATSTQTSNLKVMSHTFTC